MYIETKINIKITFFLTDNIIICNNVRCKVKR